MAKKTEQNLIVLTNESSRARENEVIDSIQPTLQTNPIARKLLDFSLPNKTRKFSVKDLFSDRHE